MFYLHDNESSFDLHISPYFLSGMGKSGVMWVHLTCARAAYDITSESLFDLAHTMNRMTLDISSSVHA